MIGSATRKCRRAVQAAGDQAVHDVQKARFELAQRQRDIKNEVADKPRAKKELTTLRSSRGFKKLGYQAKADILRTALEAGSSKEILEGLTRTVNAEHFEKLTDAQRTVVLEKLAQSGDNIDRTSAAYAKLLDDSRFKTTTDKLKGEVLSQPVRFAAAANPYRRPLTAKNQRFVKRYGFADLPNDKVRQYRDECAALLTAAGRIDRRDSRFSCLPAVEKLIKEAGSNPKARPTLEMLQKILVKDKASLTANGIKALTHVLDHLGPAGAATLGCSRAARRAAVALAKNEEYMRLSPKKAKAHTREIIAAVAEAKTKPKRMAETVSALVGYTKQAEKPASELAVRAAMLAKLRGESPPPMLHDIQADLCSIAGSKNPSHQCFRLLSKLKNRAWDARCDIHDHVTAKYADVLTGVTSLSPKLARKVARKLYDVGGPQTTAGAYILASVAAKENMCATNEALASRVAEMGKKMLGATSGLQSGKITATISEIKGPSGRTKVRRGWIAKINNYSDTATLSHQAIDTGVSVASVCGAGATISAASSVLGIGMSILQIPLTLAEIGHQMERFKAGERAQFAARADRLAHMVASKDCHKGKKLPPMSEVYDRACKMGREDGLYGAMSGDAYVAHRKQFAKRYRFFRKMTPEERENYFEARLFVRKHLVEKE